jgi:hypothetical protein
MSAFPSTGLQILSSLIHFLGMSPMSNSVLTAHSTRFTGITILTHFISRSVAAENLSWKALSRLTWPRLCTLIVFLDSWLFLFASKWSQVARSPTLSVSRRYLDLRGWTGNTPSSMLSWDIPLHRVLCFIQIADIHLPEYDSQLST